MYHFGAAVKAVRLYVQKAQGRPSLGFFHAVARKKKYPGFRPTRSGYVSIAAFFYGGTCVVSPPAMVAKSESTRMSANSLSA
jgi:hypothetical protein